MAKSKTKKTKMSKWKKVLLVIACVLLAAGLGFLLFPPVSNFIGKQIANGQTEEFDRRIERIITDDDDADTGIIGKTYEQALKMGEIDKKGYPVDKKGKRTANAPVVFQKDLERLRRDSEAYNEKLKTAQASSFVEGKSYDYAALDLPSYGIMDGIYAYIDAPTIGLKLPVYLGTNDTNMSYGAAHMTNTSLPVGGASTNSVAGGHTGYVGRIFFDNIRNLHIGDKVYVRNYWETLTYEVAETHVGSKSESEAAFIREGQDLFTMFTCTPFGDEFGRYFVVCRRVGAPQPTTEAPTQAPASTAAGDDHSD